MHLVFIDDNHIHNMDNGVTYYLNDEESEYNIYNVEVRGADLDSDSGGTKFFRTAAKMFWSYLLSFTSIPVTRPQSIMPELDPQPAPAERHQPWQPTNTPPILVALKPSPLDDAVPLKIADDDTPGR